jgi:aspartate/methionine/tyrosine aminotransferase
MTFLNGVNKKLKERATYFTKRINEMEGLSAQIPQGAFYSFPRIDLPIDDTDFVLRVLKETGVVFVFGSGFGALGKQHFRSVVLPEIDVMEEALNHVELFMKELR